MNILKIIVSFIIAIFIYKVWYKITVGKLCPAMWYGSAPLVIIGGAFLFILLVFRKLGD